MTTPRPGDAVPGTAVDVAAIRDRWAKATPGPWEWEFPDYGPFKQADYHRRAGEHFSLAHPIYEGPADIVAVEAMCIFCSAPYGNLDGQAHRPCPEDADAIAHAPQDISDLLAEVARLRAALEAGRGE